jgi:3-phytase
VAATLVRTFNVGAKVEGCVADDELETFYIGEERKGVWKYGAEPTDGDERVLVDDIEKGHLQADVEGLTLFYGNNGQGYFIASSQGSDEFMVYTRQDNTYLATFTITSSEAIDHVSGTDGIDVTNVNLGDPFSQGLFVVQDNGNGKNNQNFKLVPWEFIAESVLKTSDQLKSLRAPN